MRTWAALGVAVLLALSCRGSERPRAPRAAPSADSLQRATSAESIATARDLWNKDEVEKRLREAGLVVADSGLTAHRAGLHVPGVRLAVSGSDLELYFYPDAAARRKDSAALDTTGTGLPSIRKPRFIFSGNLIAVHTTAKDLLAERVENVLTARHTGS
jgi:hypothetical protein